MCTNVSCESNMASAQSCGGWTTNLTFQQQGWWKDFHSEGLNKLDTVFGLHLTGFIVADVLRASIHELIRRHESLRTTLIFGDEGPIKQIALSHDREIEIVKLDNPSQNTGEVMRQIVSEFARRKVDVSRGPLFDAKIVVFSNEDHLLVWGANHFIVDGHSLNLMSRELWMLYREFSRGRPSPLAPLSMHFAEYEIWQKRSYQDWYRKHAPYWRDRLSGAMGIRWPIVRRPDEVAGRAVSSVPIALSHEITEGLRALAEQTRTTLSLVVMAVYVAVVARWCNQRDLVVETTFNGRDRLGQRNIVGFLAHFLYLRFEHVGEKSVAEFLQQVRQEYFRTLSHKDFGGVVTTTPELLAGTYFQWLSWAPDGISGIPSYSESAELGIKGELIPIQKDAVDGGNCNFQVSTMLWDSSGGIRGDLQYRLGLFTRETMERFVQGLVATAARFVECPVHSQVEALTEQIAGDFCSQ